MKSISLMIEEILIKKDISQQELALQLKVSPSQITRWINNDCKPRIRMFDKIKKLHEEISA